MENLENKTQSLRDYEDFKEYSYQYRVDEILESIEDNDSEFIGIEKESDRLYKELKEMLGENEKKLLLNFADAETDKRNCELYALAKQVYKDVKER